MRSRLDALLRLVKDNLTLCFFLMLGVYFYDAPAQEQISSLKFETLSQREGLSGYVTTALEEDDMGFLWVGTQRGLNRYSSAGIRIFERDPDLPGALIDDDITVLLTDAADTGELWIGTESGGLSHYDPITERFQNFTRNSSSISSNKVLALATDQRGELWIGTDAGLNLLSRQKQSFKVFRYQAIDSSTLAGDTVRVIYEPLSTPGKLWIGTTRGLSFLEVSHGVFDGATDSLKDSGLKGLTITAIAEVKGTVWLGTHEGFLYRYTRHENRFETVNYLPQGVPMAPIYNLRASRQFPGYLWIGTFGQGLVALNTNRMIVSHYSGKIDKKGSLSGSYVNDVFEDDSEILWVATRSGLNKASLKKPFQPFIIARNPSKDAGEGEFTVVREASGISNYQPVLSLYSAPSQPDLVWLSLMGEGIWRYHRITKEFQPEPDFTDKMDIILALHEDRHGNLWIGGIHPNLFLLDRNSGTVSSYPLGEMQNLVVHQILQMDSHPNFLWIATRDLGLLKFDIRHRTVVAQYSADAGGLLFLGGNNVMSVTHSYDDGAVLWLGVRNGGLNRLDTRTDSVKVFSKSGGYLPSDALIAVAAAGKEQMWLGTYGDGLLRFDLLTETCKAYTKEDGLPDKDVSAIFVDSQQRLWLSTSNGLSLYDPEQESFTNFTEDDGLQSDIFHYQARHQNSRGEILLGGSKGFNIFHRDSVLLNRKPSNVVITNLLVDGKPHPLVRTHAGIEPITLSFLENDLRFDFAVLDLRQPVKNRYKVMLEGAEDGWRQIGNQPYERYPLLAAGSYTFRVTGANSDGHWNPDGASLSFVIKPPFWKTWWFWALLAVSGFGLVIGAYQYRIYQLKQLERTRKRIADDLHDDIGSKMSSIALMVDVTGDNLELEEEQKDQISEISATAREVVDDLRDAVWLVDAGHDDLAALVGRMKQVAAQILKGQSFRFQKPEALPSLRLKMEQRRHLFLLYKEMLHNVLRHAKASHVEIEINYANSRFILEVRDDGVGFDPANARRGRGLSTLQTRAKTLNGKLQIDSKPGDGTKQRFTVRMA